ncbi:MAG: DegT/DnrJ/EryC1/StrS family aminotransferase [Planctomycetales bacterium]|nr:DegT/DnrJ/EryC1/StrS family aminotransferase [Planctomycetales bacterium]
MKDPAHFPRRSFVAASALALTAVQTTSGTDAVETLAIHGGPKACPLAFSRPKRWGNEELSQLAQAVEQPSLYYWQNKQTNLLTKRFQDFYHHRFVQPCSSGTAALHIAVAAAGIGPGDEVITSAITDIGTVIGVIFQNAVPIFADLDPLTYNLDPDDVARKISPRTKAIIAVHLKGNPCRMQELRSLADRHDLVLIEDCAQGWGAKYRGQPLGTLGDIACFSLQDSKHITCGDGGVVATNSEKFGPLLIKYGDKAINRLNPSDSSNVIACNYRMSELQAAFVAAQLQRLEGIASKRSQLGSFLTKQLEDVDVLSLPRVEADDRCVYWSYMCRLKLDRVKCSRADFIKALAAEGVSFLAGYIRDPLYRLPMFQQHSFFAGRWPIKELGLTTVDYQMVALKTTEEILETCMRFPLNEGMDENYLKQVALAVRKVARFYAI